MPKLLKTLKDLKPAQYNPRSITPEALSGLGYSLQEFGDLSGIVFNTQTGNLVCGHQRVKALQEKYGNAAIVNNAIKANGHAFPIRLVEWPYQKELAANIAANSPTIQGDFTEELNALLEEIQIDNPELYDTLHFEDLELETEPEEYHGQTDPDELPQQNAVEPRCKPGDLWQLGRHRLLCGDATNADDVGRLMDWGKADMVFTDPPYDLEIDEVFSAFDNCSLYANFQLWMGSDKQLVQLANKYYKMFKHFFVQDFINPTMISSFNPMQQHTLIAKFGNKKLNNLHDAFSTLLNIGTMRVSKEHAQFSMGKNVELPEQFIKHYSKKNEIILDVFGGYGSTLIACERVERVCRMIELKPDICDLSLQRYENFTGEQVELLEAPEADNA